MKNAGVIIGALATFALLGCGRSGGLETAQVSGTVTLDGQPYTHGGSVVFQPEARGKMATSRIQPDGSFQLSTYSGGDGAIVGKHIVSVRPPAAKVVDESADTPVPKSPIPSKYRSPASSGLSFEVRAGELNTLTIDLKSK